MVDPLGLRGDGVADTQVDLNRQPRLPEHASQPDSPAAVLVFDADG
jgi:hypothetical protein